MSVWTEMTNKKGLNIGQQLKTYGLLQLKYIEGCSIYYLLIWLTYIFIMNYITS